MGWRLSRFALVQQAASLDGLAHDAFAFEQDGLSSAEMDIGRGEVLEALVIALVLVVLDEGLDLRFEVAGRIGWFCGKTGEGSGL
jgi:hypothetical protein